MKYLAAIDIGTTGAKAAVLGVGGVLLGSAYREYACSYPRPGWVEQDADELVSAAFDAMREAVARSGVDPGKIAAVAASTQRTCAIFIDGQGRALKLISWQDARTAEQIGEITARIHADEYYRITGLPLNTTWIATKILWARRHDPELMNRTHKVVQLQDYCLHALGAAEYHVDIPDAVLYGLWDNDNAMWSKRILGALEIDESLLPTATKCGTLVGEVTPEAARRTGLAAGTRLCVGAGDQNAAAIGAGVDRSDTVSVSIGTGGMAIKLLDAPYRDPNQVICVGSHAIPGKWQIEGYQVGAAGVFRWFRDVIAECDARDAESRGQDAYARLNEMIASTPPGADGLLFLPYFAGSAAPRWDVEARGTLIGLTFAHGRAHIARAFMEGITMEQKDILRSMAPIGSETKRIRLTGGAAKSALWCQMQADMYGAVVETLRIPDATLVGAAILAGVGAGIFADISAGIRDMVVPEKRIEPNPQSAAFYDELYGLYASAYESLRAGGVFSKITEMQGGGRKP